MKRVLAVLAIIAAAGLFAACGDTHTHGNGAHNHANGSGHGHGDHHEGPKHPLGELDLGNGLKATVAQIGDVAAGKEGVFEVSLTRDGKPVTGAELEGYVGDENGKELGAPSRGEWMADEKVYDVHGEMPKNLPDKLYFWVRVRDGGKELKGKLAVKR
jgi:hypothetical protein